MKPALSTPIARRAPLAHAGQRGATLALVLVLLVAISMLGVLSLRGAVASERIAQATRTQALALQAAEIALQYCESALMRDMAIAMDKAPTDKPVATAGPIVPRWTDTAAWDQQILGARHVPLALLLGSGTEALYRRAPECLAEDTTASPAQGEIRTITARGFGPDVPAEPLGGVPAGTEVWVQSQIAWPADGRAPLRTWRQLVVR